ncbi:MAG: Holliday junction resolvase RuvX [Longimicrobiales bacterium]|nr:Holliday junction resolvase RuvX [Longimicrobiales bacterium]
MGIDYGERRIGVALSDPTGTIASPLPTLKKRRGKRPPYGTLEEIAHEHGVEALVMGLPLSPAGAETEWTAEVRRVGDKLADRLDVPVHYVDERMTSARAERVIRGRLGLSREQREQKERIDAAAAVLILQSWLDRPESSERPSSGPPLASSPDEASEPGEGGSSVDGSP